MSGPAPGVAAGAFAMTWCAGLPAIGALIGGITIAAVLGVAGGVLAFAALAGGAIVPVRAHRRRRSSPPSAGGAIQ